MDNFFTWDMLLNYTSFIAIVFMVVEFTKDMPLIKKMHTQYWSFIISFILLLITNLATGTFESKDLILYILTSISISLGSNGLSDFSKKKESDNNDNNI